MRKNGCSEGEPGAEAEEEEEEEEGEEEEEKEEEEEEEEGEGEEEEEEGEEEEEEEEVAAGSAAAGELWAGTGVEETSAGGRTRRRTTKSGCASPWPCRRPWRKRPRRR
jgi:hypothetical protein